MEGFNDENGNPITSINAETIEDYIKALDGASMERIINQRLLIPFEDNDYKSMIKALSRISQKYNKDKSNVSPTLNNIVGAYFTKADDKGRDQIIDSYIKSNIPHEDIQGLKFSDFRYKLMDVAEYDEKNNRSTYQPSKDTQFILAAITPLPRELPDDFAISQDNIAKLTPVIKELAINHAKGGRKNQALSKIMVSFANNDHSSDENWRLDNKRELVSKAINHDDILKITNPAYVTPHLIESFAKFHRNSPKLADMYNFVKSNPNIKYDFNTLPKDNYNDAQYEIQKLIKTDNIKEQLKQGKAVRVDDIADAIANNPSIFDLKKDIPTEQMASVFYKVKNTITPEKSLQFATEIVKKVKNINVNGLNSLIEDVSSLKLPNVTEFYLESKKFFDITKNQLAEKKAKLAEYEIKYDLTLQEMNNTIEKHRKKSDQLLKVEALQKAFNDITPTISPEQAENVISSIVSGENKNAKIEFAPSSDLKKLFMATKKKQEEATLQQDIQFFNQQLYKLADGYSLKEFQGKILNPATLAQLQKDTNQLNEQSKQNQNAFDILTKDSIKYFGNYGTTPQSIGSSLNRQERDFSIFNEFEKEQRPKYLKEKSKENLAAKGMSVEGSSGIVKADELADNKIKAVKEAKHTEYEDKKQKRIAAIKNNGKGDVSGVISTETSSQAQIDSFKENLATRLADSEEKDKKAVIETISKQGIHKQEITNIIRQRKNVKQ